MVNKSAEFRIDVIKDGDCLVVGPLVTREEKNNVNMWLRAPYFAKIEEGLAHIKKLVDKFMEED